MMYLLSQYYSDGASEEVYGVKGNMLKLRNEEEVCDMKKVGMITSHDFEG
jgi:hypothetical protein